ncbi:MAG: peptidoglycan-binding protein [Myxococcota bacterium]
MVLKNGNQGDEVKELQQKLTKLGLPLEADGIFGAKTKDAVEQLQQLFGYDTDGIVGDGTAKLIDAQLGFGWCATDPGCVKKALEAQGKKSDKGHLAGADLTRNLQKGAKGADVAYLQRRLTALGIKVGVTGEFDDATEKAVKTLQNEFGYTVDGIVGPGTHTLINAQLGFEFNLQKKRTESKEAAPAKKG